MQQNEIRPWKSSLEKNGCPAQEEWFSAADDGDGSEYLLLADGSQWPCASP